MNTLAAGSTDELGALIAILGHNWLLVITVTTVVWLMITRLVEAHEAAAKILGPLGRHIQGSYRKRQDRYRTDVAQEAKQLAIELLPKVIPADYEAVKGQLHNIIDRVGDLEIENSALRSYVVYDEEWHFQSRVEMAQQGRDMLLPLHIGWMEFLDKWRAGWRPSTFRAAAAAGKHSAFTDLITDVSGADPPAAS